MLMADCWHAGPGVAEADHDLTQDNKANLPAISGKDVELSIEISTQTEADNLSNLDPPLQAATTSSETASESDVSADKDTEADPADPTSCQNCNEPREFCLAADCLALHCDHCEEGDGSFSFCERYACSRGGGYCSTHADNHLTACSRCERQYCCGTAECMECGALYCGNCEANGRCECSGCTEQQMWADINQEAEYYDEYC